ncbi:type II toxin-antitoxin system HicB family antitoxin [Helicobacter pylori]
MLINAVIEKDENGYFAFVPFLKGCVSQGKSYEEALRNIDTKKNFLILTAHTHDYNFSRFLFFDCVL